MTIWFTSDTHFGHENILKYTDRPFKTIKEHDEGLIKKYNEKVKDNDVVYFLGDIFFSTDDKRAKEIMDQLKGNKILVKGNHDKNKDAWYYAVGFFSVLESAQIRLGQKIVNLSHYPYRAPFYKRLYWYLKNKKKHLYKSRKFKNLKDDGRWLLHGHTHTEQKINKNMIHIGLDAWDCYPVSATEILTLIDKENNKKKGE